MINTQNALQAKFCECPSFALNNGKVETQAQAAGRRYEERAIPFLTQWAKGHCYSPIEKPWIKYFDASDKLVWCQPDWIALGEDSDNLLLVEIKLRHCREAFQQLRRYKAVLQAMYPSYHIIPIELCKIFDNIEFKTTLLPELRPHSLEHAAVLFDPREWTHPTN